MQSSLSLKSTTQFGETYKIQCEFRVGQAKVYEISFVAAPTVNKRKMFRCWYSAFPNWIRQITNVSINMESSLKRKFPKLKKSRISGFCFFIYHKATPHFAIINTSGVIR